MEWKDAHDPAAVASGHFRLDVVPPPLGEFRTPGPTSGAFGSRPRGDHTVAVRALSVLGLQAHCGRGPKRRRPRLQRSSDLPHHAGVRAAAEAHPETGGAASDAPPVRAAAHATQRAVADGRHLRSPAARSLVVRGDGDRLLLALPPGVPPDSVPERRLGGGCPGSGASGGGTPSRSAGPGADAGHRQRLVLPGAQVPEALGGSVLPRAHPVSDSSAAGTAGTLPRDAEEGGGVLAAVRRTQPCPAVSRRVPGALQPRSSALGLETGRAGRPAHARRRLRGRSGGDHSEMAGMGAGSPQEAQGNRSRTRGRIAMNDEISLQRKIPTIYDSKTPMYLIASTLVCTLRPKSRSSP